ncbi:Trm112 family protein [Nocardioides rotundus]|nr:Trm112 family protein [Nocardioides rotundus]UAL28619.1 Trm112 family protein [Nocardioides rotundus]
MNIDPALMEIIVCPACRSDLRPLAEELECTGCGRIYPVRDEVIPVLLVDEARTPA